MFKITDFRNIDGKITVTIETDDSDVPMFLRFLSEAQKFSELFHYKVTSEKRYDAYQKSRVGKMVHVKKRRSYLLSKWQELTGPRYNRLKVLREMVAASGDEMTIDRLEAELQMARDEEKGRLSADIQKMLKENIPPSAMADLLKIPKTTVSRYVKELRGSRVSRKDAAKARRLALVPTPPEPKGSDRGTEIPDTTAKPAP